ncbi:MAG: 4-hydroxy-tetrahydrodipicolinate synthase [Propionibacteriales bacterium]|nr:4-hydroxy-tetrahydrodipicolinate synthase [Propionibacteriales bacterium]
MSSSPLGPAPFGRMLTAMVTPFTADGELDLDQAQRLAAHLVDHGHDGLVILGTTGEAPTLADSEDAKMLRAVVEAVDGRAVVVAGVGTNDSRHSIELAKQAEKCAVDALLVVTPYYNKPPQAGVAAHFLALADSTGLPVMLYDIPGRTGTRIAHDTFARVAHHERIVAVKDATGDLSGGVRVMQETGLAYYSGDDALNLAWLTHGASGLVSVVGHVAGDDYAAMIRAVDDGDLARALEIYRRLQPAVEAIMTRTQGAIMVKAALSLQGVLDSRTVRPPLVEATPAEIEGLRPDLVRSGLLEDGAV